MFPRVATSLLSAALLIFPSVVPCCAISKLLASGERLETVATPATHACSCYPLSKPQKEPVPAEDRHSPDGNCPYCGGLLFHSGVDDATLSPECQLVFAWLGDARKLANGQPTIFPQSLQQQILGQPFLNTGMRLLI